MNLNTEAWIHNGSIKHDQDLMQDIFQRCSVGTKGGGPLVARGVKGCSLAWVLVLRINMEDLFITFIKNEYIWV